MKGPSKLIIYIGFVSHEETNGFNDAIIRMSLQKVNKFIECLKLQFLGTKKSTSPGCRCQRRIRFDPKLNASQ